VELRRYWRVVKRRAWIPLVLVLATTLTVGALSLRSKPQYVATATVEAKVTTNSSAAPTQTLSLQEVVASNTLALAVVDQLNLAESPASLSQRIRVTAGHSDLYAIAITDPNADTAVAIANAVAAQAVQIYQSKNAVADTSVYDQTVAEQRKAFLKSFDDAERALLQFQSDHPDVTKQTTDIDLQTTYQELVLEQQAASAAYQSFVSSATATTVSAISEATHFTASVLDPAVAKPDLSTRYLRVAYGGALALLLGIGLIFFFEYMDNAIREPESVEELVGLPVVGIIPKATTQTLRQVQRDSA